MPLIGWLAKHYGPMVASNLATNGVLELYRDHSFNIEIVDAPRRMNRTGDRMPAKEVRAARGLVMALQLSSALEEFSG